MQSSNQLIKTLRLLKQNLWIILFSTIIFAIGGYLFNVNFVTPTYRGTTQLVAKTNMLSKSDDTLNAANYKLLMINTYKSLATSYSILDDVQKKIKKTQNIDLSVDQISQMVTVSQEDNSQIFSISVVSETPRISQIISGNIAESLSSKVGKLLGEENSISIISPARASSIPISPNIKLNTVMFAMIGWLLSVTAIFIWALTNQFVEKEDNFEEELGLRNLGTVVEMKANQSRKNKLYVIDEGR